MGSSISYVQSIVLVQAAAIAVLGTIIGIGVFLPALPLSRDTLFLTITPRLIAFVTIATIVIGLISSMGVMYRLHRLDPAMLMR